MTCSFNKIPVKIPMAAFKEVEKIILKITQNHKRPWVAYADLSKNKSGGVLLSKYIPKLQQSKKNVIGIKKKT
jgi:hypothetical protein